MITLRNRRAVVWIERAILCMAVLYLGMHTLPRSWKTLNTDFPNYYVAARLVHEGYDTSRMYEWSWIEREKDHRGVDIRVIGLLPITPFSTLAMLPLSGLAPLAAKHVWIAFNLFLLIPLGYFLRSLTSLSYQRVAIVILLSFPLHRNLLFGQFYIFLLLILIVACWSYLRGLHALAGTLVAVAAACKVFPLLLFVFFLQRRAWRALAAGTFTSVIAIGISIAAFGVNANRTWLVQILPWVLHGEGMPPYVPSASISGILHILFLSEPQWNPHPWHESALAYALLVPTLQMLALAPAILLIQRNDKTARCILLEWSALITASLATSTIPASYNFVLMVFPGCVLVAELLQRRRLGWATIVLLAYLSIGLPIAVPAGTTGIALLLYSPRLFLMMAILFSIYLLLWGSAEQGKILSDWTRPVWVAMLTGCVVLSTWSTLRLERGERQEYAYRLPLPVQGLLNQTPQASEAGIRYSAFTFSGYHLLTQDLEGNTVNSDSDSSYDDLSFSSVSGHLLMERASSLGSQIIDHGDSSRVIIANAHDPILSADSKTVAYLRDEHGVGSLMLRQTFQPDPARDTVLTSPELNVYEASFLSEQQYAFSAVEDGGRPMIYLTDATHHNARLPLEDVRYPALSPNGRWLAYSQLHRGVWNLWIRDQATGLVRRVADVPCNQIQPSWESDSRTLLYATDCGRSVWFTAVARRTVIP